MKTIKIIDGKAPELRNVTNGMLLRINDKAAKRLVDNNEAEYASKSEWKEQEASK
jgi:hypothetical protein|tara:strand:+ start:373 stop:537 length:165 start_codon:yes stop_codon:yes gene_type:complete